jgi:hypothetical protein
MKLYHGSTVEIIKPEIITTNKFLDFGNGFYTSSDRKQAANWAEIKRRRLKTPDAVLNIYEIAGDVFERPGFSCMVFENADKRWLEFVIANRKGAVTHNYDLVKGKVADDTIFQTIALYETNVLTFRETIRRLKTSVLYDQILFHTEKALMELNFVESVLL